MLLFNLLDDLKLNVQDAIISHNMNKNINRYNKAVHDSCEHKLAHMNLTEKIGEFARIANEILPDVDEEVNGELVESYGMYLYMLLKTHDMHEFIQKLINTAYTDEESCVAVLNMILDSPFKTLALIEVLRSREILEEFNFSRPALCASAIYQDNYPDMIQDIDDVDYTKEEIVDKMLDIAKIKFPGTGDEETDSMRAMFDQIIDESVTEATKNTNVTEQMVLNYIGSGTEEFFNSDEIQKLIPVPEENKETVVEETPIVEPKLVQVETVDNKETLKTPEFIAEPVKEPEQKTSEEATKQNASTVGVDHPETFGIIRDNIEKDAHSLVDKVMQDYVEQPKPATSKKNTTSKRKR